MNKREGIFTVDLDGFDLHLERLRLPKQAQVEKMEASLKKRGQLTPVIVTEGLEHFTLIDGFKRYRAAANLGKTSLKATYIEADGKQSKAMMYLLNRAGVFTMIQEALLVKELIQCDGLTQQEAAILLDRHKSWISRRLEMTRSLSPEIIGDLLLELIPGGVGPSLARIPPCNQADFSAVIQNHQLSANEIRRLVDLFCKATDEGIKQSILQSPKQALELVKRQIRSVSWPAKMQLIWGSIGKLERDLISNEKQFPQHKIDTLQNCMDRIKPILHEITTILEKEIS